MDNKMPRTPFSTGLSRSAKETRIRLQNIFSGPKKRPPVLFLALMCLIALSCGDLVSCHIREAAPPEEQDSSAVSAAQQLSGMAASFYREEQPFRPIYLPEEVPDQPEEESQRLDSAALWGEAAVEGQRYGLYEVRSSRYYARDGVLAWHEMPYPDVLLFLLDEEGAPVRPIRRATFEIEGMTAEDALRKAVWRLNDLEVCLFRDHWSTPIGPGNWPKIFPDLEAGAEYLEAGYSPESYWDSWTAEGLTATRYYAAEEDSWFLSNLYTTRSDLYTPRQIRVGSTRAEVLAAYPEAVAGDYWSMYPDEDLIYYIPGDNGSGLGPALLFFFQGDQVEQIALYDMFN
ncbi:hypothetical protein D7V91_05905 [bacterium 1xD42-67]|nr:hypothetical protein D7V91_05905 [bacterium 1xD42-67]